MVYDTKLTQTFVTSQYINNFNMINQLLKIARVGIMVSRHDQIET